MVVCEEIGRLIPRRTFNEEARNPPEKVFEWMCRLLGPDGAAMARPRPFRDPWVRMRQKEFVLLRRRPVPSVGNADHDGLASEWAFVATRISRQGRVL